MIALKRDGIGGRAQACPGRHLLKVIFLDKSKAFSEDSGPSYLISQLNAPSRTRDTFGRELWNTSTP
jgi:hypothetical protein